jgi:ABC-type multidrug transport system fused ATPase/permease subunit
MVVLASLAVLAQTAALLAMPYLVKVAIDQGVVPRRLEVLNWVAVAYLVLAGVQFLAGRVEVLTVASVGQRVLYAVRNKLFRHVQALSLDFYERERTGRLVARMTADIEAMSDLVTDGRPRPCLCGQRGGAAAPAHLADRPPEQPDPCFVHRRCRAAVPTGAGPDPGLHRPALLPEQVRRRQDARGLQHQDP